MIDPEGFRLNVGIILCNQQNKLFWGKRIGHDAWQFPQGGVKDGETPEQAMYRELAEETGLGQPSVNVIGSTTGWLKYHIPKHLIRYHSHPLCIGQKQKWFLLRFTGTNRDVQLNKAPTPEFDQWKWVEYHYPPTAIVQFKEQVYRDALSELKPLLSLSSD